MEELYDILCLCLIFFFALIIFQYIKKTKLIEGLTKKDVQICKDNNTAITNYSTEQTRTLGKYKNISKKIRDHTRIMKKESKEINDLMKRAEKKMKKTGATADGGKKK
tara:strand:- start:2399 stop:2722 length:324 start_codon:yes stop_codon:yes gene_type:complete